MQEKLTIVMIEDEQAIAENLTYLLQRDGYDVQWFATAWQGLEYLKKQQSLFESTPQSIQPPALVLLDVGLPDGNGFELCKTIREFSAVPIIFLTARNDEIDRVVGLEIGADDYVTKPFSAREVLARIKLRIKSPVVMSAAAKPVVATSATQQMAPLAEASTTDSHESHQALIARNFDYYHGDQALGLTAVEFKILHKLMAVSPNVLSREQLMVAADMMVDACYERNIDSHIKAIRSKLRTVGMGSVGMDAQIQTKRGFGYYYDVATKPRTTPRNAQDVD